MKWISAQEVIAFHDRLLAVLPGVQGMPEPGRAEAIIYRVQNQLYYEGTEDIHELAAMYLVAISRGHIFNDGNKRTAFFVAMAYLKRNGIDVRDEGGELEELTVSAAMGSVSSGDVAAVLRRLSISPRFSSLHAFFLCCTIVHNFAQFCTIFLMLFIPFPPSAGAGWAGIGLCTKNEALLARR